MDHVSLDERELAIARFQDVRCSQDQQQSEG